MRKVIPCLAVCHRDFSAAKRWLMWASFLATKGTSHSKDSMMVFYTKRIADRVDELREAIQSPSTFFKVSFVECPDENEVGYPMSANHLFLRTLETCNMLFPKAPALFIEPDCIPISVNWCDNIWVEYKNGGKEFMGYLVGGGHPHMTGNAIYGPLWPVKAPSIATVLERQSSSGMFPDGRGFPFDLWIANDILKDFHPAETIYQQWAPGVWNNDKLSRIPFGTVLVHQDKDGSLMMTVARRLFPEFVDKLPQPTTHYMLTSPSTKLDLGGVTFDFTPCVRASGGGMWSVFKPVTFEEDMMLASVAQKLGVEEISKEDFNSLLSQRRE